MHENKEYKPLMADVFDDENFKEWKQNKSALVQSIWILLSEVKF